MEDYTDKALDALNQQRSKKRYFSHVRHSLTVCADIREACILCQKATAQKTKGDKRKGARISKAR